MSSPFLNFDSIVLLYPFFIKIFFRTHEELDIPSLIFQAGNNLPIKIAPNFHLGYFFVKLRYTLIQILYLILQTFVSADYLVGRNTGMHIGIHRFFSQIIHTGKCVLIEGTFLHKVLQRIIHLPTLSFDNMYNSQFTNLTEEFLVFLVVHKKCQFLHFRNHASASFLFS